MNAALPPLKLRTIKRRAVLAATGSLLASPALVRAQGQAKGVALVVGNSKYHWETSLPNVQRDAPDVARRFQAMGLKTELVQNAGKDALAAAIEKFKAEASGANFAAFYFAGHGASWNNDTYLIPIDTDLANPEVVRSLVPVAAVNEATKGAAHRLLVFDNCRNNPADGWRQRDAAESARITAAELTTGALQGANVLVLFSTAPGQVALDGPSGENSPFAAAFLRQFESSSVDIAALPARLRRDLLIATDGRQVVWDQNTYTAPFAIVGPRDKMLAGSASTAVDRSRILELPHAYAFARANDLTLPPGLVAIRPASGSAHGQKVGAFESKMAVNVGVAAITGTQYRAPVIVAVLSINDESTATISYSFKQYHAGNGVLGNGQGWRLISAKVAKDEIAFSADINYWGRSPISVKWRDANSGRLERMNLGSGTPALISERFSRLD